MSVIQAVEIGDQRFAEVVLKGAPEVVGELLSEVPDDYVKVRENEPSA